ncbi:MAG: hypothetical protein FWB71_03635 [Defluviitaleaceae bacterium]|nr:hypothetical protein [Defluviitaleaceae bacterium]
MVDFFKNLPKGKLQNLVIMLVVGVLLLIAAGYFAMSGADEPPRPPPIIQNHAAEYAQRDLAAELSGILSKIAGAGEVSVMIHKTTSAEMIFAQNTTVAESRTTEADGQNGTREIDTYNRQASHVALRQSDGSEAPLIIMEAAPRIEGVVIVAQGGGDAAIREALTRAAQTVLGIRPHQVQVFEGNQN